MSICTLCPHHCDLKEGSRGRCLARICQDGRIISDNYGVITSLALDPIEKKPLARFCPGSRILSVGSFGCNLSCPFCQNSFYNHFPAKTLCKLSFTHGNIFEITGSGAHEEVLQIPIITTFSGIKNPLANGSFPAEPG